MALFLFLFCFSRSASCIWIVVVFSPPFTDAHTHPTLACDHRGINRNSLTFFLIEWRVEVILGSTRIFSPSRNICSTYGRSAAVWDSAAASEAAALRPTRSLFPTLSNVSASTKLCREAVRNGRAAGVARDAQTDVRVRLSRTLPSD